MLDRGEIDPELRNAARFFRLFTISPKWFFRLSRWIGRTIEGKAPEDTSIEQVWIDRPTGNGQIRICLFRPKDVARSTTLAPVIYLHGGGYAMGNPESAGEIIARMIKERPCVVIVPDYRKSLDEPYPAAIDDCYTTLVWAERSRRLINANDEAFAVVGHSAGGGLTAALSLRARERKGPPIAFQMPIYPMIDDRLGEPSPASQRAPVWSWKSNALGWSLYLGEIKPGSANVPYDAAPARADNLAKLPPTATMVGSIDLFAGETTRFAKTLSKAGVACKFALFPGAFHGSEFLAPKAQVSRRANDYFYSTFAQGMDRDFSSWTTFEP